MYQMEKQRQTEENKQGNKETMFGSLIFWGKKPKEKLSLKEEISQIFLLINQEIDKTTPILNKAKTKVMTTWILDIAKGKIGLYQRMDSMTKQTVEFSYKGLRVNYTDETIEKLLSVKIQSVEFISKSKPNKETIKFMTISNPANDYLNLELKLRRDKSDYFINVSLNAVFYFC